MGSEGGTVYHIITLEDAVRVFKIMLRRYVLEVCFLHTCPHISILLSCYHNTTTVSDHLNAPLLWDAEALSRFQWSLCHVPTYQSYEFKVMIDPYYLYPLYDIYPIFPNHSHISPWTCVCFV